MDKTGDRALNFDVRTTRTRVRNGGSEKFAEKFARNDPKTIRTLSETIRNDPKRSETQKNDPKRSETPKNRSEMIRK